MRLALAAIFAAAGASAASAEVVQDRYGPPRKAEPMALAALGKGAYGGPLLGWAGKTAPRLEASAPPPQARQVPAPQAYAPQPAAPVIPSPQYAPRPAPPAAYRPAPQAAAQPQAPAPRQRPVLAGGPPGAGAPASLSPGRGRLAQTRRRAALLFPAPGIWPRSRRHPAPGHGPALCAHRPA